MFKWSDKPLKKVIPRVYHQKFPKISEGGHILLGAGNASLSSCHQPLTVILPSAGPEERLQVASCLSSIIITMADNLTRSHVESVKISKRDLDWLSKRDKMNSCVLQPNELTRKTESTFAVCRWPNCLSLFS